LARLRELLEVHLLTADTHGGQAAIDVQLGLTAERLARGDERGQKARFAERLGASSVAAIGNGANDAGMLEAAALSIAVVGREGASGEAIAAANVVVVDIADALDLLLIPRRLIATLRR
jgi:soluble P-type ATPase